MKKLLFVFVSLIMLSCATPTVNQVPVYGIVEDVIIVGNIYNVKAWSKDKGKYYKIKTDKIYYIGDQIRIK